MIILQKCPNSVVSEHAHGCPGSPGRQVITDANGRNLNFDERTKLLSQRDIITDNWQKVIAESVFKYAGSTYKDIVALETIVEANGDTTDAFRKYAKHWGELKGFALALQCGPDNLGETAVKLKKRRAVWPPGVLLDGGRPDARLRRPVQRAAAAAAVPPVHAAARLAARHTQPVHHWPTHGASILYKNSLDFIVKLCTVCEPERFSRARVVRETEEAADEVLE